MTDLFYEFRGFALFALVSLLPAAPVLHAETLSARQSIAEALANNSDLAALEARVAQTIAEADAAKAETRPSLGVGAGMQHHTLPVRVRPATANNQLGVFDQDTWQADIVAEWTIYSGGRLSAAREAGRLLAEAAREDFVYFRQQLATRVAQIYFESVAQEALIAANEKSLESLREQETRISQLLAEGKAAEVDRMRVQVRSAGVEQRLIESRNKLATLKATLNLFMNRPLDSVWELAKGFDTMMPARFSNEFPTGENREALVRGDLEAARLRQQAAERRIDESRAAYRPQVKLLSAWGPRADWSGEERYESGFVGIGVNWPVWDGGLREARLRGAREGRSVAAAHEQSLINRRNLEIVSARFDYKAAMERVGVSRIAYETARESLRIEQSKYAEGRGVIIDVLDAEAAALEAESLYRRAQADLLTSQAALDLALGRVFTPGAACTCLQESFSSNQGLK